MIAIKTQENEIIMGLNYIFTMKHGQEYAVMGVESGHKKAYTLALYSTFERANEEVDRIFHTIDAQAEPVAYAMSEDDK